MDLVSRWNESTEYSKLSIVEFDNELYISTINNNKGIIPIPVISNEFIDNESFIYELQCLLGLQETKPNFNRSWIKL